MQKHAFAEPASGARPLEAAEIHAVSGARINLNTEKPPRNTQEPSGGMGYTGIMIHYTLTVIGG